jgi:hypothetical protein
MDVSQSPWKIMKYMFNKKVMSALKVGTPCFEDMRFHQTATNATYMHAGHKPLATADTNMNMVHAWMSVTRLLW